MKHSLLNGYIVDKNASLEEIYQDLSGSDMVASVIKI